MGVEITVRSLEPTTEGMGMKIFRKRLLVVHHAHWNPIFVIGRSGTVLISLLFLAVVGCAGSDEQEQTMNTTHAGMAVSLAWDSVKDSSVVGYYIHYGKRSPNQPGSCAYDHKLFMATSHGTVTNLDPGLTYYFAVSAFNGLDSSCSNEVFTRTAQSDCCPS